MKANHYEIRYSNQFVNLVQIDKSEVDNNIIYLLNKIEKEIILEYLKKQEGKIGIKSLGNEIRFNKVLKSLFSNLKDKNVVIKVTENRRSFIKIFLESYIKYYESNIYFFILDDQFGSESKLVDGSFIRVKELQDELSYFFKHFNPKMNMPTMNLIEMKGFDDFYIVTNDKYSKIQLNSINNE